MDAKSETMLVALPKTNQSIEFAAGDDGTYQDGWWKGASVANNRTRFVVKDYGGDSITIDRATGLMWPTDWSGAGGNSGNTLSWSNAIAYANGLELGGFTDWKLPNINQLKSIVSLANYAPAIDTTYFLHVALVLLWASTTHVVLTDSAWFLGVEDGGSYHQLKGNAANLLCCRVMQ